MKAFITVSAMPLAIGLTSIGDFALTWSNTSVISSGGIALPSEKCSQYVKRRRASVPGGGRRRPAPWASSRYSMMAPDSATVTLPSVMTGLLPSGCTFFSSGGASDVSLLRL